MSLELSSPERQPGRLRASLRSGNRSRRIEASEKPRGHSAPAEVGLPGPPRGIAHPKVPLGGQGGDWGFLWLNLGCFEGPKQAHPSPNHCRNLEHHFPFQERLKPETHGKQEDWQVLVLCVLWRAKKKHINACLLKTGQQLNLRSAKKAGEAENPRNLSGFQMPFCLHPLNWLRRLPGGGRAAWRLNARMTESLENGTIITKKLPPVI